MDISDNRYTIARQTYTATHDIHGTLQDIEPAHVMIQLESDSQRAASIIVDLALGDPGVIFMLLDRENAQGRISVFAQEGETREELLVETLEQMNRFDDIEELTKAASAA